MMQHVLITGGFGYLGGRLAQHLATQARYEVLLGSRQQAESPPWLPSANVVQIRWESLANLEHVCTGVDTIVHLAGMNSQDCATDTIAALEFNAVNTARMLRAAIQQGVKRFIYLSTAHVYGSHLVGVITEETCPVNLHPYATSHRAGEDVVRSAHQRGEIEGIVIRLSNAYGAPAHRDANCWMLLVNDLCHQAVTTNKMLLRSSGMQRRDFITLTDACRAIRHLLELPADKLDKGLFNVGEGWSPTIWEVACLVQQRCGVVLGVLPQLSRIPPKTGETAAGLDYRFEAICQTGFRPGADKAGEIDLLLEFCKA